MPRAGTLHRVTAGQRDPLLALRTELELLRCVHRHAGEVRGALAQGTAGSVSQPFTDEDRSELADIVRDAGRAIVDEMIAVFDGEFPELRKEIAMSVVNEEAEKIVAEAESSGVLGDRNAADPATGSQTPSEPLGESLDALDHALAVAQSELAEIVGETDEPHAEDQATQAVAPSLPVEPEANLISEGPAECNMDDAQQELADALADFSGQSALGSAMDGSPTWPGDAPSGPISVESAGGRSDPLAEDAGTQGTSAPSAEDVVALGRNDNGNASTVVPTPSPDTPASDTKPAFTIQEVRTDVPAFADPRGTTQAGPRPSECETQSAPFDAAYTPERVQHAIAAIEQGVRKLAALLGTEVNEQCHRAQEALADVGLQRDRISEAVREAGTILDELKRVRDETLNTRNQLTTAAGEARQCCEEARRARNRADHSAAAAELAAEQASREAENARASSRP